MFSFLEAPKGAVKSMNDRRERMLWQEKLAYSDYINHGGLGI
jgi:hypothetical protein